MRLSKRAIIAVVGLLGSACTETAAPAKPGELFGSGTRPSPDAGVATEYPGESPGPAPGFGIFDGGPPSDLPSRLAGVVKAEHTPPAISGGTLAVSRDGAYAVAADPDRDAIYVVRTSDAHVSTIQLAAGAEPGRVALDDAGRAHVVLRGAGELVSIELASASKLGQTGVCSLPRGLAYDASRGALLVACATGELVTVAADTRTELARSFVERDLRDVALTADGKLFVSRFRSAELLELDVSGTLLQRVSPATLHGTRAAPFDGDAGVPIPIDEKMPTLSRTMTPALAYRTLVTSSGDVLMLHQRSQVEEVVPSAGGYGGGCETITQTTLTSLTGVTTASAALDRATGAVDVAASPDGEWLAAAVPAAYVIESGTAVLYPRSAALAPAVDGDCGAVGQSVSFQSQAIAVDFGPDGRLYVQSREPAQLEIYEIAPLGDADAGVSANLLSVIELDPRSMRDTGHDLFHADVGRGLSCASCHGEGLDDGHTWHFQGLGPRRTQNIRGGLSATAPFHWDGDMTTFGKLVTEVMTGRMGGFSVQSDYADALLGWIDQQPTLVVPALDAEAVARGKALFESSEVGCTSCHSGPHLTNNVSADVGTGGLFQVPALHGLALRAPYMHDGCAASLRDRFDPGCGGTKHGNTAQLSAAELDDLLAYLESL